MFPKLHVSQLDWYWWQLTFQFIVTDLSTVVVATYRSTTTRQKSHTSSYKCNKLAGNSGNVDVEFMPPSELLLRIILKQGIKSVVLMVCIQLRECAKCGEIRRNCATKIAFLHIASENTKIIPH
jgi:hypothetical protein